MVSLGADGFRGRYMEVKPHQRFEGVYWCFRDDGSRRLATRNLAEKRDVHGEKLVEDGTAEYRVWDPFRSKLAAALLNGLSVLPFEDGSRVLYLGAASGTTASFVSDIVGEEGHVYCVEFASRSIRELINNVCTHRLNMSPIMEDARVPERYIMLVEKVDVVYCDVAQPKQAEILVANADLYLKTGGWVMLAVKAQSIDVAEEPQKIFSQETRFLERRGFDVRQVLPLEPYDKAHVLAVAKRKL